MSLRIIIHVCWISLVLLLIFGSLFLGIYIKTSDGEHTGFVTATETNGIIFKTNLVYFKTDTESTQEDEYCIIDKDLMEKLREKQLSKEKVTLIYEGFFNVPIYRCSWGYGGQIITGIK
jgi:hypothetical protein